MAHQGDGVRGLLYEDEVDFFARRGFLREGGSFQERSYDQESIPCASSHDTSRNAEDDFSELFAEFEALVGLRAFFQGEDYVDHWLEQAAAEEF